MVQSGLASSKSVTHMAGVMFITSMATFVQSFVVLKLGFLVLFLLASIVEVSMHRAIPVRVRLVVFYLLISAAGIVWSLVGLSNVATDVVGVTDALRLYVIWSAAFLVLYTLLRCGPSLWTFHVAMVASGILISAINLVGLADQVGGWGLIPDGVRRELELYVGVHDGYIQIGSNNIGAMFLIVPYLLSLQFRVDSGEANSRWTKLALALSLILVGVSGRRALWLVVALAPFTILLFSHLSKAHDLMGHGAKRFLAAYAIVVVTSVGTIAALPARVQEIGYVRHLAAAFSARDERSIQKDYLVGAFTESPLVGSGFGAYAGYLRNAERSWTYELTYHQMLFNLGFVGAIVLGLTFFAYVVMVIGLLRGFPQGSAVPFGLLIAFLSLLFGAYSNPYLRSFDYLFFVGILPYLSTFTAGFDELTPPLERRAGNVGTLLAGARAHV